LFFHDYVLKGASKVTFLICIIPPKCMNQQNYLYMYTRKMFRGTVML